MSNWIAVDLDGTLAVYDGNASGDIGKPVTAMLERVKKWIEEGQEVRIFTARAGNPDETRRVKDWLKENGLSGLKVTNVKDSNMLAIYDDKAIRVERNTGVLCSGCASSGASNNLTSQLSIISMFNRLDAMGKR